MTLTKSGYTVVHNQIFRERTLSLKALGLYCQIISFSPDWRLTIKGLCGLSTDGIDAIRSALAELVDANFLERSTSSERSGSQGHSTYRLVERNKDNGGFTMISNNLFLNHGISLRAKGLFCLLASLPASVWRYSVSGLSSLCRDGKRAVTTIVKELEQVGYLLRERVRDKLGQFAKSVYRLASALLYSSKAENPVKKETCPLLRYPMPNQPKANQPTQYIKNLYNKDKYRTNLSRSRKQQTLEHARLQIKERIEYHVFEERYAKDLHVVDAMVDLIAQVYIGERSAYRFDGCQYSKADVLKNLENLDFEQAEFVLRTFQSRSKITRIFHAKAYLLACLFHASRDYSFDLFGLCADI